MTQAQLRASIRFKLFGNSTDTTYSDDDIDSNIDIWKNTALSWILESNGKWQVNGEIYTTALVADQNEYIFPDGMLTLNKIFVKIGDEYQEAKQIDIQNIHSDPSQYRPSNPEYDILDNSIFVFLPNEITDISDGLELYCQMNDLPDLPDIFIQILLFGAVYEYSFAKGLKDKLKEAKSMLGIDQPIIDAGLKKALKSYQSRKGNQQIIMTPEEENLY